jgi:hypothetical protein
LEHFERQSRVEGQVRRESYRRLREHGISLPAPRYEVTMLETSSLPRRSFKSADGGQGLPGTLSGGLGSDRVEGSGGAL